MPELTELLTDTMWVAKQLFCAGQVTGSTGNISFRFSNHIYISATNSCFGRLTKAIFSELTETGDVIGNVNPSKEYPLHLAFYRKHPEVNAIIHTHSFYTTLWGTLLVDNSNDAVPSYTPYLKMKLGSIGLVPFAKPGTMALFNRFSDALGDQRGYLLANHGAVVGDRSILKAYYSTTELEESCRLAWSLRHEHLSQIEVES